MLLALALRIGAYRRRRDVRRSLALLEAYSVSSAPAPTTYRKPGATRRTETLETSS